MNLSQATIESVGTAYAVTASVGLIFYGLFFLSVLTNLKLRRNPFFLCALALGIGDVIMLSADLFYLTPAVFLQEMPGGVTANFIVAGVANTAWFANTNVMFIQSLNRLAEICSVRLPFEQTIKNSLKCVVFAWILAIAATVANFFPCCYIMYFPVDLTEAYNTIEFGSMVFSYFDLTYTTTVMLVISGVQGFIFYYIHQQHKQIGESISSKKADLERKKREVKVFIQFFLITAWFLITDVFGCLIPLMSSGASVAVATELMIILNASTNAMVYILMNETVRGQLMKLIIRRPHFFSTQVTSMVAISTIQSPL